MINLSFLKRSAELRKIVANTGWLFADKILRMGVGLFVSVWVARYLGVEQFGTLNFAMAFVALFSTLSTLGLPGLVIRSLTHEPEKRNEILGTTFWLQLLGGMAGLALSVSTILLFRRQDPLIVSLVAILGSVGFFQAFDTIDLWFQSQVQSRYTVVAKNTAFLIFAVVKVGLIHLGAPLIAFALATVAEVAVGAIGLIIFYRLQHHAIRQWLFNISLAKTLLKESWPLILSGITIIIYVKIDQVMLGQMVDDTSVGIYSAAARLSEVWYFIPTTITSSFAPSIYKAKNEGDGSLYYRRIKQLLKILAIISIVIVIPVYFLSNRLIYLVYGNQFEGAASILIIHIWASLFVFSGVGSSPWFIAENLNHLTFYRTFTGAVANIVLNLFLIPKYGGVGAAIATVASYSIGSFIWNLTNPKTRKIFKLQASSILLIS